MKYLILFSMLFFALTGKSLQAQTQKGAILLGSSSNILGGFGTSNAVLGFGKTTYKLGNEEFSTKYRSFNFAPTVGYAISNNFIVGATVSVFDYSADDDGFFSESYTTISASPFLRYYFKMSEKYRPFVEASAGITRSKIDDEEDPDTNTIFGAKGGFAIFVNNKVSLDPFVSYLGYASDGDTESIFGLGLGMSFFLR